MTPDCYNLPDDQNFAIQKAFAEHMWELKLRDYLNAMGAERAAARPSSFPDISAQLNQGKIDNIDVHKSFKSVFLSEVQGIVDSCAQTFSEIMQHIFERDTGTRLDEVTQTNDVSGRLLANAVYNAFLHNKVTSQFPTIRIGAGLHAALRWDRNRKYKANDLFDFRHAEAALPYCDYFLTERSLCHLVQDRNLKFNELFACKVFSEPAEALDALGVG